jgi:hypothetical protein
MNNCYYLTPEAARKRVILAIVRPAEKAWENYEK